jgi:hypothetical protein
MDKLPAIGIGIAIIALIGVSLFSGGPAFNTGWQATATQSSPLAIKARQLASQTPQ